MIRSVVLNRKLSKNSGTLLSISSTWIYLLLNSKQHAILPPPTMGNCFGAKHGVENGMIRDTTDHIMLHEGMLRERNLDVYKKYREAEVLGQGSMGQVARVKLLENTYDNTKFSSDRNKKLLPGKSTSSISDRRGDQVDYALKSIHVDRVSPQFLQELKNEIDILKRMVSSGRIGCIVDHSTL